MFTVYPKCLEVTDVPCSHTTMLMLMLNVIVNMIMLTYELVTTCNHAISVFETRSRALRARPGRGVPAPHPREAVQNYSQGARP